MYIYTCCYGKFIYDVGVTVEILTHANNMYFTPTDSWHGYMFKTPSSTDLAYRESGSLMSKYIV